MEPRGAVPDGNRARRKFVLYAGMERLATDTAPDLRNRSYTITADVDVPAGGADGVLVAHGDWCSGYTLYLQDGRLVHDYNFVGTHHVVRSETPVSAGRHSLRWEMERTGEFTGAATLFDRRPDVRWSRDPAHARRAGELHQLEVGRAPAPAVSDFTAPFPFTGTIEHVTFELGADQEVDRVAEAGAQMQRQ